MLASGYQERVTEILGRVFGNQTVIPEWSVAKDAADMFHGRGTYAPRLDIAVGPFNITPNVEDNLRAIDSRAEHPLIRQMRTRIESPNPNPRCLLAIEIEFSGSSKHILGDFTNASMMGWVGVVIGNSENTEKIRRVGNYAALLHALGKAPSLFRNVLTFQDSEFLKFVSSTGRW